MARARSVQPTIVWKVISLGVKTRDGPNRVAETYRILLGHRQCRPIGRDATHVRERSREKEEVDGSRIVCPRINGTPGA